jgi:hypothetical protein
MERELINATPAYVLGADLVGGAEVTVSRAEAWRSLVAIVSVVVAAVVCSGGAIWFAAANV